MNKLRLLAWLFFVVGFIFFFLGFLPKLSGGSLVTSMFSGASAMFIASAILMARSRRRG
jgi:hypothetical protein